MRHQLHSLALFLVILFSSCSSVPNHGTNIEHHIKTHTAYSKEEINRLEYTPLCKGIEIAMIEDKNVPIIASIAKVSLKHKNLKIIATEKERFKKGGFVFPEKTFDFAKRWNTILAVNANFFDSKCFFLDRLYKTLGLFISDGMLLSEYNNEFATLNFKKDGNVIISNQEIKKDVAYAISGLNKVIEKGKIIIEGKSKKRDSRTLIGIDEKTETLFILCIDGENKKKSRGETLFNASIVLQLLGSYEGIELDGGGSTSLIIKINGTHFQLSPFSKKQKRRVAVNLGILVEENQSTK